MISQYIRNKRIKVTVKPNAKKTEILSFDNDKETLFVAVRAPADKNKANIELLKLLTKEARMQARIKSGITSKEKLVEFS